MATAPVVRLGQGSYVRDWPNTPNDQTSKPCGRCVTLKVGPDSTRICIALREDQIVSSHPRATSQIKVTLRLDHDEHNSHIRLNELEARLPGLVAEAWEHLEACLLQQPREHGECQTNGV